MATPLVRDPPTTPPELHPTTQAKQKRRRFSHLEKLGIIRNVRRKIEVEGISQRAACEAFNIHHTMFGSWQKQQVNLRSSRNNKAKSLVPGRTHSLEPMKDRLLHWIFEKREQGMPISMNQVVIKATEWEPTFAGKSSIARYSSARHFIRKAFINNVARPKVSGPERHPDFIINMDQTPVPFSLNAKRTLELAGRSTICIRKSTNDTKRATFALTVTASGKQLKPLLVFNGARNVRIVQREFQNYPEGVVYACQQSAWMDEQVMLMWVETVLAPYVKDAPDGIVPLLFLDSYRCHMMRSVVDSINALGVEVDHIPGGCTCLCQPVDVGINKPFKNRIRDQWEAWMIREGLQAATTRPPRRDLIASWVVRAMVTLQPELIQNAWRHAEFSWFPRQP